MSGAECMANLDQVPIVRNPIKLSTDWGQVKKKIVLVFIPLSLDFFRCLRLRHPLRHLASVQIQFAPGVLKHR